MMPGDVKMATEDVNNPLFQKAAGVRYSSLSKLNQVAEEVDSMSPRRSGECRMGKDSNALTRVFGTESEFENRVLEGAARRRFGPF